MGSSPAFLFFSFPFYLSFPSNRVGPDSPRILSRRYDRWAAGGRGCVCRADLIAAWPTFSWLKLVIRANIEMSNRISPTYFPTFIKINNIYPSTYHDHCTAFLCTQSLPVCPADFLCLVCKWVAPTTCLFPTADLAPCPAFRGGTAFAPASCIL